LFSPGNIVNLDGDVLSYRAVSNENQSATLVDAGTVDPSLFTMAAPIPVPDMEAELEKVIDSIEDGQIKLLVTTLIKNHYQAYITFPAAVRNHHEYASGLLYHTLSMIHLAEAILPHYRR
jgi:3'-5' exoribonuclease